MATTNRPPASKEPAKKKAETSQSKRLTKLEADMKVISWLYAELLHEMRKMFAQAMLQNPQVQQQLQERLIQQMYAQQTPPSQR